MSKRDRTALVLQHEDIGPPALIGRYLADAGWGLDVRRVHKDDWLPGASEYQAIFILGGDMNVGEESEYPFLLRERELIASALHLRIPTLGVCLGAQQLATCAGGGVLRLESTEVGWHSYRITATDDFTAGLKSESRAFYWHSYGCRLPDDAVVLAWGRGFPQVFRIGDFAWGVQFHPEVTYEIVSEWCTGDPATVRDCSLDLDVLLRETSKEIGQSAEVCATLVKNMIAIAEARIRVGGQVIPQPRAT